MSLTIIGWWHSTQVWKAWIAETPYGIFKIQSESSIFGIGAQFFKHEHRWTAFSNGDPITGDHMKWITQMPRLEFGNGLYLIILPYWQIMIVFLISGALCLSFERKRIRTATETNGTEA